jgi:hypothetical protein
MMVCMTLLSHCTGHPQIFFRDEITLKFQVFQSIETLFCEKFAFLQVQDTPFLAGMFLRLWD